MLCLLIAVRRNHHLALSWHSTLFTLLISICQFCYGYWSYWPLPHCMHLCLLYCIQVPCRVLYAVFPACYLSRSSVFHALLLQAASPRYIYTKKWHLFCCMCLSLPMTCQYSWQNYIGGSAEIVEQLKCHKFNYWINLCFIKYLSLDFFIRVLYPPALFIF